MTTPPFTPNSSNKGNSSKVAANLAKVREVLDANDDQVTLVAVTKHATIDQIAEAYDLGVKNFGENKIQDALKKREELNVCAPQVTLNSNWHFIGHLQTNKVKQAVGNFSLIHSVDSLKLAREVSRVAEQKGIVQNILLQVKLQDDENKSGFSDEELRAALPEMLKLPAIKINGLMTISPLSDDRAVWAKSFEGLKKFRDSLSGQFNIELKDLSMGMSDDWRDAITYGSTIIRLGRAIFGN